MSSKRYVLVPGPARVPTPAGDALVTWEDFSKAFFRDPRWHQQMDYEERGRVRQAFVSAGKGDVLALDDDHWKVAAELAKRPHTLSSDFLDAEGGVAMLDAIRNATTKHPHDKQEKGPKAKG